MAFGCEGRLPGGGGAAQGLGGGAGASAGAGAAVQRRGQHPTGAGVAGGRPGEAQPGALPHEAAAEGHGDLRLPLELRGPGT